MAGCPICAKHRGSGPLAGLHVWQDPLVTVFHAPGPALGHLHVETLRHVPHLADLTDDEAAAVGRTAARLARALRAEPGVAMVHSAVAGLAIPHFHQHVLVRTEGTPPEVAWHESDDWAGALRGDDADIAALCARLRSALESAEIVGGSS